MVLRTQTAIPLVPGNPAEGRVRIKAGGGDPIDMSPALANAMQHWTQQLLARPAAAAGAPRITKTVVSLDQEGVAQGMKDFSSAHKKGQDVELTPQQITAAAAIRFLSKIPKTRYGLSRHVNRALRNYAYKRRHGVAPAHSHASGTRNRGDAYISRSRTGSIPGELQGARPKLKGEDSGGASAAPPEQIAAYERRLQQAQAGAEHAHAEADRAWSAYHKLTDQVEAHEQTVADQTRALEEAGTVTSQQAQEIQHGQQRLDEMRHQLEALEGQTRRAEQEVRDAVAQAAAVNAAEAALKGRLAGSKAKAAHLERQVQESREAATAAQEEARAARSKAHDVQRERDDLQVQIRDQARALEEQTSRLEEMQQRNTSQAQEIAEQKGLLDRTQVELKELSDRARRGEERAQAADVELAGLRAALKERDAEVDGLRQALQEVKARHAESVVVNAKLVGHVETWRQRAVKAQGEFEEANRRIQELEGREKQAAGLLAEVRQEIEELKAIPRGDPAREVELQLLLDEARREIDCLKRTARHDLPEDLEGEYRRALKELQAQKRQLEASLRSLEKEHGAVQAALSVSRKEAADQRAIKEKAWASNASLRQEMAEELARRDEIQQLDRAKFEKQERDYRRRIQDLSQTLKAQKQEVVALKGEAAELEPLRTRLRKSERLIQELQAEIAWQQEEIEFHRGQESLVLEVHESSLDAKVASDRAKHGYQQRRDELQDQPVRSLEEEMDQAFVEEQAATIARLQAEVERLTAGATALAQFIQDRMPGAAAELTSKAQSPRHDGSGEASPRDDQ